MEKKRNLRKKLAMLLVAAGMFGVSQSDLYVGSISDEEVSDLIEILADPRVEPAIKVAAGTRHPDEGDESTEDGKDIV